MKIAIVGATGVVGAMLMQILDEREIAVDELSLFASRDRIESISFRGRAYPVAAATAASLVAARPDVVFFASSDDASAELAGACVDAGAIVIDNSSTFRMDPNAPLVVPEVNGEGIDGRARIYPVANCTAIVLCVGIAPIVRAAGLRSLRVATYQAVSGAGRAGLDALDAEERAEFALEDLPHSTPFAAPIFRNVVPQIGAFDDHGDSVEEKKVIAETRKILAPLADTAHIAATTVRVPVRRAHSEAVFIETDAPTTREALHEAYRAASGVVLHEDAIVTPRDVEDTDTVHVARLRSEGDSAHHWQAWIVGDQLRKGAATNAVQIMELLVSKGVLRSAAGNAAVR